MQDSSSGPTKLWGLLVQEDLRSKTARAGAAVGAVCRLLWRPHFGIKVERGSSNSARPSEEKQMYITASPFVVVGCRSIVF